MELGMSVMPSGKTSGVAMQGGRGTPCQHFKRVGTSLENRLVTWTSEWRCYYFIQSFKVFLI